MHLRYPQLPEPEKGAAVVLIDEFDLHMHVRWQMEMIDHLSRSFPNTQFIITAHSPLIIQAADGRANIAVLERVAGKDGNDEVVIRNDPSYVRGWRIDQIITSDLYGMDSSRSKTYADLMNRRRVLLQKENLDKGELEELDQLTERLSKEAPPDKSSAQEWLEHQLREAGVTQPRKGRKLAL
jgi:predicted ATP-binding protein involved in virulence